MEDAPIIVGVNGHDVINDVNEYTSNNEKAHMTPITSVVEIVSPDDNTSETCSKILAIIYEYALNKFEDTVVRHAAGAAKFLSVIEGYVSEGKQVKMCLPAFPFKSANKVYKVFGILPDKAEELAMQRLNTMCERIADVYPPGAKLTIISDGLVYNGKFPLHDS
jgi:pyoverdine/dityrosine biosynthesis protein Dit1